LTVSFAPDGTSVAGQANQLFSTFGKLATLQKWEQSILNAFQTWASQANINVGLVPDNGSAFGTAGLAQGDPRFGDIRIAAVPMGADVFALSIPTSSAVSGRWMGDILFNSNADFENLSKVFAVALHEIGHVLGVPDSSDPLSPMYENLPSSGVNLPTSADIAVLQQVYGKRSTEQAENSTPDNAAGIGFPSSAYDGSTPLLVYGALNSPGSSRYFALSPLAGYSGTLTFQLRTTGISQLQAQLTICDGQGNVLAQGTGDSGQNVSISVDSTASSSGFFIKVDSPVSGIDSVGTFALVTTFDGRNTVTDAAIDAAARGRFTHATPDQIQQYFRTGAIPVHGDDSSGDNSSGDNSSGDNSSGDNSSGNDSSGNDSSGNDRSVPYIEHEDGSAYSVLRTTPRFAKATDYTAAGRISTSNPSDMYRIAAPSFGTGQTGVLTVTVWATEQGGLLPAVSVTDDVGNPLAGQVLINGLGTYTLQVTGIASGGDYFVSVAAAQPAGPYNIGGYALHAQFGSTAVAYSPAVTNSLSAANPVQYFQLDIAETQLMQLGLSTTAGSGDSQVVVQLAVFDSSGNMIYQLLGTPGSFCTAAPVLLNQGNYVVGVNAVALSGALPALLKFSIYATGLSEPVGPVLAGTGSIPPSGSKPGVKNPQPFNWSNSDPDTKRSKLPHPKVNSVKSLGWSTGYPPP
jgi:hypothetical protein